MTEAVIGFYLLCVGGLVWFAVENHKYQKKKNAEFREAEEIFERIMQYGTDEQKMIAMTYKNSQQLGALKGLVMFDIFFN